MSVMVASLFHFTISLVSINLPLVKTYGDVQFDALGDATRRAILSRLQRGALSVGKLAGEFPMSRPAISQHLRVLKQAKLVTDRADGTRRLYQVDPAGIAAMRKYFDQFWGQALDAFKAKVEEK
jgi:DNA-binding transcriptional ArsR family regulator